MDHHTQAIVILSVCLALLAGFFAFALSPGLQRQLFFATHDERGHTSGFGRRLPIYGILIGGGIFAAFLLYITGQ